MGLFGVGFPIYHVGSTFLKSRGLWGPMLQLNAFGSEGLGKIGLQNLDSRLGFGVSGKVFARIGGTLQLQGAQKLQRDGGRIQRCGLGHGHIFAGEKILGISRLKLPDLPTLHRLTGNSISPLLGMDPRLRGPLCSFHFSLEAGIHTPAAASPVTVIRQAFTTAQSKGFLALLWIQKILLDLAIM